MNEVREDNEDVTSDKKSYLCWQKIRESLQADCQSCFGLCCTALNIVASSDFAINKPAGSPCPNLQDDYSCHIHSKLQDTGFKGCTVLIAWVLGSKCHRSRFMDKIGDNPVSMLTSCFGFSQSWNSFTKCLLM